MRAFRALLPFASFRPTESYASRAVPESVDRAALRLLTVKSIAHKLFGG